MILLVALSQSNYSSSADGRKLDDREYDLPDDVSSASASLLNSSASVGSILSSNNNTSSISCRQLPIKLEQTCANDPVLVMNSEEDGSSDNLFIHSDESSSFYGSSIMNEANLNERRRTILDLSMSKIQTMNASNVAVSLRKSLLIYNTMKSLQRDLDAYDVFVCGGLIERENEAVDNDVEMLATNEFEEKNWEQPLSDFSCDTNNDINSCSQYIGYNWPCGTLVNTSQDTMQGSGKCGSDNLFTLASSTDLFNTKNICISSGSADSFVDDYLGMLCAWEDENYNPLTNCSLTRAEIMNMFHLPSYHLNNQLVSQA